jgi:chromosome segregation ATPase
MSNDQVHYQTNPPVQRVTEKHVHDACQSILLTGTYPSVEKIQLHLGRDTNSKKGSSTTVHKYQRTWLENLKQSQEILLPSPIPQSALDAIVEMWAIVKNQASQEYSEIERQLTEDLKQSEAREHASSTKNSTLRLALDDLESTYHATQSKLTASETINAELILQTSKLETSIENHESRYLQLQDNHSAEITRLTAKYERAIMQLDTELEAATNAKQEAKEQINHERERSNKEIDRWMSELDSARQEIKKLTESSKATKSRLSADVTLAEEKAQSFQVELSNLKDRYHQLLMTTQSKESSS